MQPPPHPHPHTPTHTHIIVTYTCLDSTVESSLSKVSIHTNHNDCHGLCIHAFLDYIVHNTPVESVSCCTEVWSSQCGPSLPSVRVA